MNYTTEIKCPFCEDGEIESLNHPDEVQTHSYSTCSNCDGTGKVDIELDECDIDLLIEYALDSDGKKANEFITDKGLKE